MPTNVRYYNILYATVTVYIIYFIVVTLYTDTHTHAHTHIHTYAYGRRIHDCCRCPINNVEYYIVLNEYYTVLLVNYSGSKDNIGKKNFITFAAAEGRTY